MRNEFRSGRPSVKEQLQQPDFSSFSFGHDIAWKEMAAFEDGAQYTFSTTMLCEGREVYFRAEDFRYKEINGPINRPVCETLFSIQANHEEIHARVVFQKEPGGIHPTVRTSIVKERRGDGDADLPPGLGLLITEKVLEFIQVRVDEHNEPALDWVISVPVISREEKKLTKERWNEMFVPILEKYGYEWRERLGWQKWYYPRVDEPRASV